jgi:CheY-like chemotaxis protein
MSPRTILVVDDESAVRRVVSRCIRAACPRYQVLEARDGLEALSVVSPEVALIVSDVNMPRLDGFELCRAVRSQEGPSGEIPLILLTSRDGDADRETGAEAGATRYLTKPLDQAALNAALQELLGDAD